MKDYSELKGLLVKRKNHRDGLKFKGCYVAEIDDCGLTILGYCLNHDTLSSTKLIKVFCLRNEIDFHLEMFSVVVEMILNGVIDITVEKIQSFTAQPNCAFE